MPYMPLLRTAWTPTVTAITADPTIVNFYDGGDAYYIVLKNNDDSTATLKYEINDSTPDLGSSSFTAGQQKTLTINYGTYKSPFEVYVTAQATGKTISNTISYSYDL